MPKMEIFCEIRKRNIKVDEKLAHALVKMKRASYNTKVVDAPVEKVMVAETPVVEELVTEEAVEIVEEAVEEKPKKRRGRKKKKKEEVDEKLVEENIEPLEEDFTVSD